MLMASKLMRTIKIRKEKFTRAQTYDFGGYATRYNIKCADGRTIRNNAFSDQDGQIVPLVYQHNHMNPANVIGHCLMESKDDGMYAWGSFNDTELGEISKKLVQHGDIRSMSIHANKLTQKAGDVYHGTIREVSLVLSPANPGAVIEYPILEHDDDEPTECVIYSGEELELIHSDDTDELQKEAEEILRHADEEDSDEKKKAEDKDDDKTVGDVYDAMTDEQKSVVLYMIDQAINDKGNSADKEDDDKGEEDMKHNVFENDNDTLQHGGIDFDAMMKDAKRLGSLREAYIEHSAELAHAEDDNLVDPGTTNLTYGVGNLDYLFPDARTLTNTPEFIKREQDWVQVVMNGTHHTPFSRIKSLFADITADEARAKGYTKGNLKTEEVFGLLKRTTTPTTIYKKQKMDRDDVIDITDFDVIAWLKSEMRMMLDEEIARAILVGDGRGNSSDDKINEQNVRPIYTDDPFFAHRVTVARGADDDITAKNFIRMAVKSRKEYKGSGNPTLFTTEDVLTDMLLLEDDIGHKLYKTESELATALRVTKIVTVPVMENLSKDGKELMGIIVNLTDYNVGADKGGAVSMFEDFDIDYNQQKYLIETRCPGALIKPKSAIILEKAAA